MEFVLAILTILCIFVGLPIIIGFAIGNILLVADRRARRSNPTANNSSDTGLSIKKN